MKRNRLDLIIQYVIVFSLQFFLFSCNSFDTESDAITKDALSIDTNFNRLSDQEMFKKLEVKNTELIESGFIHDREEVEQLLKRYKSEFIKTQHPLKKYWIADYYIYLANNALKFHRNGERYYYLYKADKELKKVSTTPPLLLMLFKASNYLQLQDYDAIINLYTSNRDYFLSFPGKLSEHKIDPIIASALPLILEPISNAYATKKDTNKLKEIADLSDETIRNLKDYKLNKTRRLSAEMNQLNTSFTSALATTNDDSKLRTILSKQEAIVKEAYTNIDSISANYLHYSLIEDKLTYYTKTGQTDSIIHLRKELDLVPDNLPATIMLNRGALAELLAKKGQMDIAFNMLSSAFDSSKLIRHNLMVENDKLLNSFILAEQQHTALLRANQKKLNTTIALIIISIISLATIWIIYYTLTRKNRNANKIIMEMNQAANVQIAIMEEIKSKAIKEEQKRLGRNLHDDLSASLAAARLQLEQYINDNTQENKEELSRLSANINNIYNQVRSKSHEYYLLSNSEYEKSLFSAQIRSLFKTVLPIKKYETNITIDDNALQNTAFELRIELLRITQECLSNIFKHANASEIDILLYEDDNNLIYSVKDNGTGLKYRSAHNGIGLNSIKERAERLKGSATFTKLHPNGTEVVLQIPLQ